MPKYKITRVWYDVTAEEYQKALDSSKKVLHDEVTIQRVSDDRRPIHRPRTFCEACSRELSKNA